jgi:hypothetical protein
VTKKRGWPVMPFILFIKLIREDFISIVPSVVTIGEGFKGERNQLLICGLTESRTNKKMKI